jgi:hypothetical protein
MVCSFERLLYVLPWIFIQMKKIMFLLLMLITSCWNASADGVVLESNFSWDPLISPRIIVYASVNDSEMAPFIFDSGFSGSVMINRSFNGIKVSKSGIAVKVNSEVKVDKIKRIELVLNTAPKKGVMYFDDGLIGDSNDLDSYYGHGKIAGVLGSAITQFGPVSFDFDSRKIKFGFNGSVNDIFDVKSNTISIKYHDPEENGYMLFVPANIGGGSKVYALFDTGADISLFSTTGKDIKIKTTFDFQRDSYIFGKKYKSLLVRANKSIVFDKIFTNSNIYKSNDVKYSLLGMDFISKFNFSIDYKSKVMYLNRRDDIKANRGDKGFEVELRSGKLIVSKLSSFYAGDKELRKGDEIMTDGKILTEMQWSDYLNGWSGDIRKIEVRRGGTEIHISYKCRDVYEQ